MLIYLIFIDFFVVRQSPQPGMQHLSYLGLIWFVFGCRKSREKWYFNACHKLSHLPQLFRIYHSVASEAFVEHRLCSSKLREINDFYASYEERNTKTWHSTSQLHKNINVWAWRHGIEQKNFSEKWSRAKRFLAIWYRIIFDEKKIAKSISIFESVFAVSSIQKNGICKFERFIYHRNLNKSFQPAIKTSEVQVFLNLSRQTFSQDWSQMVDIYEFQLRSAPKQSRSEQW